jgi:dienelactone hydrolase
VASQGFVVMTIDTNSTLDLPPSRGDQLNAALTYLTTSSAAASRTDRGRLAVMGWSMGGGGTFEAASRNPSIRAIVPLAPWHTNTNWASLPTPGLVVACQNDAIAPNGAHSQPLYNSLGAPEKAYLEIAGGDHFCVTNSNTTIAKYAISWLKRWADNDTRYSQFLCTGTPTGASAYRNTCPIA